MNFNEFLNFILTVIPMGLISSELCVAVLWGGFFYFAWIGLCNLAKYSVNTYSSIVRELRSLQNEAN